MSSPSITVPRAVGIALTAAGGGVYTGGGGAGGAIAASNLAVTSPTSAPIAWANCAEETPAACIVAAISSSLAPGLA